MEPNSAQTSNRNKSPSKISNLVEPLKENSCIPVASFDLLNNCGTQLNHSRRGEVHSHYLQAASGASGREVLSAEIILKVAKMKLQKQSENEGINSDFEDLELVLTLTLAAEKIFNQEFDVAEKLLGICPRVSATAATPLQKVIRCFSEALREKIDKEKGRIDLERKAMQLEEFPHAVQLDNVLVEVGFPFTQITGVLATRAILESVGSAARLHIIDFTIRSGAHWPTLMQAVAGRENCPLELLKITAVGAPDDMLEEIGQWLSSFAESNNIPFVYKIVLSPLEDITTDLFELDTREVVAVYLNVRFSSLLPSPNHLEAFVGVITDLYPSIMVVGELEWNTNSTHFLHRFYEAMFFCSAMFDCFETCLKPENQFRKEMEAAIQNGTRDSIVSEDEDRFRRHGNISFWRGFFSRFGIVEMELSQSSLFQASLVIKTLSCWHSFGMKTNGKSVIMEWKGTPIKSVSAWKFKRGGTRRDSTKK